MRAATCWVLAAALSSALAAGCRQQTDSGAAKGSTGAMPASTATGVPPQDVPPQRVDTSKTGIADAGAAPPAAPSDKAAGDASTARAQLNPPDPGRPSANPEKGVTQPDPGYGHDHSSPKYGSAPTR